ncbi:MAG: hypothetical protein K0A90_08080 [Methanosarcinaceae archaeon]|nr:hypothetical protein [Methanosarcinaceae archaeon]
MFAGIKFAAILTDSIAVLTAMIGSEKLEALVFEDLISFSTERLLAGALPAIGLALFLDVLFTVLEKRLSSGRGGDDSKVSCRPGTICMGYAVTTAKGCLGLQSEFGTVEAYFPTNQQKISQTQPLSPKKPT